MKNFRQKTKNQELNITALIDVIFILLVFFMVSSSFVKPTISVKLPVASSSDPKKNKKLSVYIGEDLATYLEKDRLSLDIIQEKLAAEIIQHPDLTILLYADQSIAFKHVVKVLDALKLTGVKNVAITHS